MHELTYQAMLKEFLELENEMYTYEVEGEQKTAILNENDPLWPQLRHLYIGDAINFVVEKFKSFSNEAKNINTSDLKNISEMQNLIQNLPKITELKSKYSLHMNLSRSVSKFFTENVKLVISREQDFSTKQDFQFKKLKTSKLLSLLKDLFQNKNLDEPNRLRLLLIFIASQGFFLLFFSFFFLSFFLFFFFLF